MNRRRLILIAVGLAAVLLARALGLAPSGDAAVDSVEEAFRAQRSGVMLTVEAVVSRTLADDDEGSRHQRFIARRSGGHTVLVAHNIDLAPRLSGLSVGDSVTIRGQYEWNDRGGVLHWTHHDPDGDHPGGWIEWKGRRYE